MLANGSPNRSKRSPRTLRPFRLICGLPHVWLALPRNSRPNRTPLGPKLNGILLKRPGSRCYVVGSVETVAEAPGHPAIPNCSRLICHTTPDSASIYGLLSLHVGAVTY